MTATTATNSVLARTLRVLIILETLAFVCFALLHLGVRIPLGFAVLQEPQRRKLFALPQASGGLVGRTEVMPNDVQPSTSRRGDQDQRTVGGGHPGTPPGRRPGAGLMVFALVDHSGEAAKVGLSMPDTKLLIFGSPAGAPIMLDAPLAALDLPLKVLVWENPAGGSFVSHLDPAYLGARHQLADDLTARIVGINAITDAAVAS
jgi:uncharacterized protein DUF302